MQNLVVLRHDALLRRLDRDGRARAEHHLFRPRQEPLADGLEQQAIPPLTLQPLVENAIYHGIQPRPGGGTIRIEVSPGGEFVYLMVQNSKVETDTRHRRGNRVALANIEARVRALFGETAVLKHSQQQDTYTVTIRLPRRPLSRPPGAKTRDTE